MDITRRDALKTAGLTAMAASLPAVGEAQMAQPAIAKPTKLRITQSVCQWCYRQLPLTDFFKGVVDTGLTVVDLLNEEQWTQAKEFGLKCSMGYAGAGSIPDGLNDPKFHDLIVEGLTKTIPKAKRDGVPNLIVFFGNRRGMADADGIKNSIACLNRIKGLAEDNGITITIELLNSKVDHKDYMGDRTPYGAEIVRAVNSPHVKLLYDIYHMQIMEGDVIRTIRTYKDAIGHYHTGGVPGRHELDATQELNWPAVTQAIIDTGFKGFMAHEFIPVRDPLTSLREAVALCDV
jgi:hydroxypyruvate isomerase